MLQRCSGLLATCGWIIFFVADAAHGGVARKVDADARADTLARHAAQMLGQATSDARREALKAFEEAIQVAPQRADLWLAFGNACVETGHLDQARSCFGRAARLTPDNGAAWRALGSAWKRDWLASLERTSLDEAADCFRRACRTDSMNAESWSAVAVLTLLQGRPRDALAAALSARQLDREGAEPLMAMGAALFRLGMLDYADSSFQLARPRLAPELRRRFDPEGALRATRALDSTTVAASTTEQSPWRGTDPDLTTPENEAQLDYLARLTLAKFLFGEGRDTWWDMRAELFVRYGPPGGIVYNPVGSQTGWDDNFQFYFPLSTTGLPYPYDMQIWVYPDLGMSVAMWDRSLSQHYELPHSQTHDPEPHPDPSRVAARPDLVALGSGRGVFRAMPPGSRPMSVSGAVSRFPLGDAVRVVASAFTAGEPSDTLWGTWAVVNAEGRVFARGSRALSIAACDPTAWRVATFAASVPPGDYHVDLSVSGPRGRRGVAHLATRVEPIPDRLAISDLILLCSGAPTMLGTGDAGVEPSTDGVIYGANPVTAYCELEHLQTGVDGQAHFSYTYTIHAVRPPARGERSPAAVFEATREAENTGSHRRQFITASATNLPPGAYVLRLEVHDMTSGASVAASVPFTKDAGRRR